MCYVLISRQSTRAQGGACTVHRTVSRVQVQPGGRDFLSLSPSRFRTCIRSLILNCEMCECEHALKKPSEFTNSNTFALYQLIRNDINGYADWVGG